MADIDGNKALNQKGYILLESLLAFLILTLCISFYLPLTTTLLVAIKKEKIEVDLARIAYEQSQKIVLNQDVDSTWQTGKVHYTIALSEINQRKGIHIYYEGKTKEIDILSNQIITP
ncbi:type II secretion system protein [Carnobacterium sp. TMP28]|uniref:type II secretion system protein n=1 Tax=Carnobacterium sp. TMP28 TaxID=3397060 RepID=UPI0039E04252